MKEMTERFELPQSEIESLARCLLSKMLSFFENEDWQKEFEAWMKSKDTRNKTKILRYKFKSE